MNDDVSEDDTGDGVRPPEHLADLPGMDMVRWTLEQARGAARTQGKEVGQGRRSPTSQRKTETPKQRRTWSGPGLDLGRDPQLFGAASRDLAKTRGWSPKVAEGAVFSDWEETVGESIAEHATPTALRDGVLSVSADSTAWATQLRMVQAQLLAKIADRVGDGIVTALRITGPTAPSWRKGPRHISGRGPRDTYG